MAGIQNVGIVFAGGGGKGAWQLGVWKALQERDIRANAVAGTSVGSLNAALYAQGNYERAVDAWMSISNQALLQPNLKNLCDKFSKFKCLSRFWDGKFPALKTHGFFSQEGLASLLEEHLDLSRREDFIPAFAAAHCKDDLSVRYFELFPNQPWHESDVKKILVASAAIPYIFDNVEIEGKCYSDGGFDLIYSLSDHSMVSSQYNNSPVEPLVQNAERLGVKNIILLALSRDELMQRPQYGQLRILPLLPGESLGGISDGCLDFDPAHVQKRIDQGYRDAQEWLDLVDGFLDNNARLDNLWSRILAGEKNYLDSVRKIKVAVSETSSIDCQIDQFNQIICSDRGVDEIEVQGASNTLEERLRRSDGVLLDGLAREDMDHLVQILVDENRHNSSLLGEFAMDATAALMPVESRATEILEQNFFARLRHGITGKNSRMNATSLLNLAQAQYASLMLIQKLQKENLLQFEMCGALHARLNRLAHDAARLQENVNRNILDVYHSMALVYCKVRKQLQAVQARLDDHDDRLKMLEWERDLRAKMFFGRELVGYPEPVRLVLAAMDFFQVTAGHPDEKKYRSLRPALNKIGLENTEISVGDILRDCRKQQPVFDKLKRDFRIAANAASDREDWFLNALTAANGEVSGMNVKLPAELLAAEIIYSMRRNGWTVRKTNESEIRSRYLDKCGVLREIAEERAEDIGSSNILARIAEFEKKIKDYYFKVYLIGEFSSGKSSLLNCWLDRNLLPHGIAPETAVATELFYASDERIVFHPIDPEAEPQTLFGVYEANLARIAKLAQQGNLLCVQIFLNNPQLQNYSDICMVDMPGLSSAQPSHEFALNQFILSGGIGIFCVPMKDGTILSEAVRFLQKMETYRKDFYLLMTKADEVPQSLHSEILGGCSKVLHNKLGIPEEEIHTGIVSVRNNIDDFTRLLDALVDRKDEFFDSKFQPQLANLCEEFAFPLKLLLSRELSTELLDDKIAEIDRIRKDLPRVLSDFTNTIDHAVPGAVKRIVEKAKTALRSIKSGLKQQIKAGNDCSGEISSNLRTVVLYELNNEAEDVFREIVRKADEIFGEKLGFSVTPNPLSAEASAGLSVQQYTGVGAGVGGVGGAIAGAVAGSFLPVVGTIVGAVFGMVGGLVCGALIGSSIDDESKLDSELSVYLDRQAEAAKPAIETAFAQCADKFKQDLKSAMEAKLSRMDEQLNAVREKVKNNRQQFESLQDDRRRALDRVLSLLCDKGEKHESK